MSRLFKRSLIAFAAVASALALVICSLVCAQEADAAEQQINLVTLGDSYTVGYGLEGSLPSEAYTDPANYTATTLSATGFGTTAQEAYPSLLKSALEKRGYTVNLSQLAQVSMRSIDLRVMLDDSFEGDAYTSEWYFDETGTVGFNTWSGNLDTLRAAYKEAITNADIITLSIGQNDFFNYLSGALRGSSYGHDYANIFGAKYASQFYICRNIAETILVQYSDGALTKEKLKQYDELIDTIAYALLGYETSIDYIIDTIYTLNPDVELICPEIINLFAGVNIKLEGLTLPLGEVMNGLLDVANTYLMTQASHHEDYYVADATEADGGVQLLLDEIVSYDGTLTQNMRDLFNVYKKNLKLESTLAASLKAQYGSVDKAALARALESTYDKGIKFMQQILSQKAPVVDALLSEDLDMSSKKKEYVTLYIKTIRAYATAQYAAELGSAPSASDPFQELNAWVNKSNDNAIVAYIFTILFGNAYSIHPSAAGQQQIATAILKAHDEKTSADAAYQALYEKAQKRFIEVCKALGPTFIDELPDFLKTQFEKDPVKYTIIIMKLLGQDELAEAFEKITSFLGIKTFDDMEAFMDKLEAFVKEFAEKYKVEVPCNHSLKEIAAKDADCCHAGHSAYYQCTECGKYFADSECTKEITDLAEVNIPALGHKMLYVKASVKVKTALLGKANKVKGCYVCTRCGNLSSSKTTKAASSNVKLLQIKWYNKKILAYYQVKTSAGYKVYYGTLASSSLTQYKLYTKLKALGWTKSYKTK